MKFGGTSVGNSDAIQRAVEIVRGRLDKRPIVVVSALTKVTDALYKVADACRKGDTEGACEIIGQLEERHLGIIETLISDKSLKEQAIQQVKASCGELTTLVRAICTLGELTPRSEAKILSKGELLSSAIIYYVLNQSGIPTAKVDARDFIITKGKSLKGEPVIEEICARAPEIINKAMEGNKAVITQGFIGSDGNGNTTVLGRGGSDYSASLIGMAVDADVIEIWTDVDGVRTADPRRVTETHSIEKISFEEAAEMAHFGAKVLHPLTIEPAVIKNIPVCVLNSMNPDGAGTRILQSDQIEDGVKSLSFKENIAMINIYSTKMINISGFLLKVFEVFAKNGVSVDLISTSEANISLTIDGTQDYDCVVDEISQFAQVHVDTDKSQVSIIGKNVARQRGLLRWAMSAMKQSQIYMTSQAASSDNLSFVVDRNDLDEVLQDFHIYLFG